MDDTRYDMDKLQSTLGFGKWQVIQFILLTLFYIPWALQILGILVIGFLPDFACLSSNSQHNSSIEFNKSLHLTYGQTCEWFDGVENTSETCSGEYVYAEPKEASIVSEWDLVCGQTYLVDLSQTVFTVGLTVGTALFTPIADKYGRKKVVIWVHTGFLLVSLANCLANNITAFIIARFFLGAFLAGTGMVGFVLTLELFASEHRTLAALVANVVWGVFACSLPTLGYLMKGLSWKYVQLAMSASSIIVIGQYIFIDESIRWLVASGRLKEAIAIMRKAAKLNGTDSETITYVVTRYFHEKHGKRKFADLAQADTSMVNDITERDVIGADDKCKANIFPMELLRHTRMRRIFLVMSLAWFTNALTYFGLYMLSTTMPGDRYLNLFFSAIAELPPSILLFPVILKCRRRQVMTILHILGAASLITAAVLQVTTEGNVQYITLTCAVVAGKISITGTYNLIFLYTPEVFPTNIRSVGFGITSIASRIGGFLSPFVSTVAREVPWVPAVVFGVSCLIVALVCPLLPETRGKDLPQTLEDLDTMYLHDEPNTYIELKKRRTVPTVQEDVEGLMYTHVVVSDHDACTS